MIIVQNICTNGFPMPECGCSCMYTHSVWTWGSLAATSFKEDTLCMSILFLTPGILFTKVGSIHLRLPEKEQWGLSLCRVPLYWAGKTKNQYPQSSGYLFCIWANLCVISQKDGEYIQFAWTFGISIFIAYLLPLRRIEEEKTSFSIWNLKHVHGSLTALPQSPQCHQYLEPEVREAWTLRNPNGVAWFHALGNHGQGIKIFGWCHRPT